MKKSKILVISTFTIIILFILISKVLAYFTAYTNGIGNIPIYLDEVITEIEQKDEANAKIVNMNNIGNRPCYARVKVFVTEGMSFTIESDGKWQIGTDGYIYYSKILNAGEATDKLIINYDKLNNKKAIVIGEAMEVTYDENGQQYSNWDLQYNYTI